MPGYGYGMGIAMLFFWVLALVVIGMVVAWFVRGVAPAGRDVAPTRTAVQIIEERYARGEIGREEFMQKKKDLES